MDGQNKVPPKVDPQTAELDALVAEGVVFSRDDVRESAVRVAESVKNPKSKDEVREALEAELERIDIERVADKTAGVVVASMLLADIHNGGKMKGQWSSPSAFIDSSWRQEVDMSDADFESLVSKAKNKAEVNIGYAILTTANSMMKDAEKTEKQVEKRKELLFEKIWHTVFDLDKTLSRQGFAETGQRADQIVDAASTEGYGARSYVIQVQSSAFIGIVTMDDGRVRKNHQKLHMKAWPSDSKALAKIYPPNGQRCRCRARGFESEKAARLAGFTIMESSAIPRGGKPDPGYDTNPYLKPYRPDFSSIPDWLIKALDLGDKILHISI